MSTIPAISPRRPHTTHLQDRANIRNAPYFSHSQTERNIFVSAGSLLNHAGGIVNQINRSAINNLKGDPLSHLAMGGCAPSRPATPIVQDFRSRGGDIRVISRGNEHVVTTRGGNSALPYDAGTIHNYTREHKRDFHGAIGRYESHRHQKFPDRRTLIDAVKHSAYKDIARNLK
ncbi:hypothetical protein [Agarilytica rhodophyticola]|uniref:hypothetical protein n=1 Tax=Agarilytica rhodophyticola TaxID=1737490 RepID=UPI000B343A14|nr:hypothetical protein [Agarilytica rhodophyticola]